MNKTQSVLQRSLHPRGDSGINAVEPTGQTEIVIFCDTVYKI